MLQIRNILRYAVAIALNVFVVAVFHSYVNLVLLAGLLLFPLYSIYGVYKVKSHLAVTLQAPAEDMHKGEEFLVHILLENSTWFPLVNVTAYVKVSNSFYGVQGEHELNMPLRAHGKTEAVYPVVMEESGHFMLQVSSIQCVDLLGIYTVMVPVNQRTECIVLPEGEAREQEAGNLYQKGVSEAMESKEKGYDFSEVSGIREYVPGDKLQNIHWKLSSKKDDLMVKERVSVSAMQLHVVVELVGDEIAQAESVLELSDSVTKAFVRQNLPFTVHYYSVTRAAMQQMYIGNEIERRQWLELLLYDTCYKGECRARELFRKEYPSAGTFLYVGPDGMDTEDKIIGEQGIAAALI